VDERGLAHFVLLRKIML